MEPFKLKTKYNPRGKLSRQHFTWSEWMAKADSRPGHAGANRGRYATSQDEGRRDWSGAATFREAQQLAARGWPEGTARIQQGLEQARNLTTARQTPPVVYDVGGELPDVGLYCAGEPEHMMSWDHDGQSGAAPVVSVAICGTQWARLQPHHIEHYGLALLAAVDALEQSGKAVELYWYTYITDDASQNNQCLYEILLKGAGDHMEIDRMSFALAHPAMNRRLRFAVSEILAADCDIERTAIRNGYGMALAEMPEQLKEPNRWYAPNMAHICDKLETLEDAVSAIGEALDKALGLESEAA